MHKNTLSKLILMHFEVVSYNLDPFYSKTNQEHLARSIKQMEATGGTTHELVGDFDD